MKKRKKELSRKSTAKNKQDKPAHPLRKEILGLLFLLIAIILAGSLFSYYPNDRLFWNVTGPVGKAHNLFGTVGAHLAGALFDLLGFSAFWLAAILLAISFISFRGKPLSSPLMSIIATIAMLASFSAILNLQFAGELGFRGGKITAGGLVGLHLAGLTEKVLNHFGGLSPTRNRLYHFSYGGNPPLLRANLFKVRPLDPWLAETIQGHGDKNKGA